MDCLFGFLLLALMLFLFNKYLNIKRESMSQSDVINTTLNKKDVLTNTATLAGIRAELEKNKNAFLPFLTSIKQNKADNDANKVLLTAHVNKTKEEVEKNQEELDNLPDIK